jgi:hypothetical protein
MGLKNSATAKVRFGQIKKKFFSVPNGATNDVSTPTKAVKSGVGSGTNLTPSKIKKSKAGGKATVKDGQVTPEKMDDMGKANRIQ